MKGKKNGPVEICAVWTLSLGYLLMFVSIAAASGHLLIAIGIEIGVAWLVYALVRHYREYGVPVVPEDRRPPDPKPPLLYVGHYMFAAAPVVIIILMKIIPLFTFEMTTAVVFLLGGALLFIGGIINIIAKFLHVND